MMDRSVVCCLALVLFIYGSVVEALAPKFPCRASIQRQQGRLSYHQDSLLRRRMVEEKKENTDERSIEEVEREASRKVASSLMFSWNLKEALTKTAWAFVLVGFLLNLFGYDYVFDKDNWGLRIDTIENKQFQQELVRASKSR